MKLVLGLNVFSLRCIAEETIVPVLHIPEELQHIIEDYIRMSAAVLRLRNIKGISGICCDI
jgi:hypothetical protein